MLSIQVEVVKVGRAGNADGIGHVRDDDLRCMREGQCDGRCGYRFALSSREALRQLLDDLSGISTEVPRQDRH